MALRELTFEQLKTMVDTTNAGKALKKVRKAVADLYGPSARYVEIDADGEYNDEGGTDYYARHMEVFGEDKKSLEYDYTTSFWKRQIKENEWDIEELKNDSVDTEDVTSEMICELSDDRLDYGHRYDLKQDATMPKIFIEE